MGLALRDLDNRLCVVHSENGNVSPTADGSYLKKMGTVSITAYGSDLQEMGTVSPTAYGSDLQEMGTVSLTAYVFDLQKLGTDCLQQLMGLTFSKGELFPRTYGSYL